MGQTESVIYSAVEPIPGIGTLYAVPRASVYALKGDGKEVLKTSVNISQGHAPPIIRRTIVPTRIIPPPSAAPPPGDGCEFGGCEAWGGGCGVRRRRTGAGVDGGMVPCVTLRGLGRWGWTGVWNSRGREWVAVGMEEVAVSLGVGVWGLGVGVILLLTRGNTAGTTMCSRARTLGDTPSRNYARTCARTATGAKPGDAGQSRAHDGTEAAGARAHTYTYTLHPPHPAHPRYSDRASLLSAVYTYGRPSAGAKLCVPSLPLALERERAYVPCGWSVNEPGGGGAREGSGIAPDHMGYLKNIRCAPPAWTVSVFVCATGPPAGCCHGVAWGRRRWCSEPVSICDL
ncbi:hypothetical protein K439DRAFT_1611737 [Ramaria rubella]|nr:hypothetical protein K439DRAFT_1611737 [Ramaria rubella]